MQNSLIRHHQWIDNVFTFRNVLIVEFLLGISLVLSTIL